MAKKTTKTKTKTRRPLTISIHGEDLHVEAKFSDAHLSELLADTIKRVNSSATTSPRSQPPSAIAELVAELGRSLRKDQVEMLMNTFDMAQKVLFMEIMNTAKHEHAS
jgi:hypothetical protein